MRGVLGIRNNVRSGGPDEGREMRGCEGVGRSSLEPYRMRSLQKDVI